MKDPNLRRCSHASKGVWIEILCLMHESSERGYLATSGVAWSDEEIAQAVGGDKSIVIACIIELTVKGVAKRDNRGSLYNSRMVADEQKRKLCGVAGKQGGGNPNLPKGESKGGPKGQVNGELKGSPKAHSQNQKSESEVREREPCVPEHQKNQERAIALCTGIGVPEEFIRRVWLQHDGTTWRDSQGRDISNFKSYVAGRYQTERSYRIENKSTAFSPLVVEKSPLRQAWEKDGEGMTWGEYRNAKV